MEAVKLPAVRSTERVGEIYRGTREKQRRGPKARRQRRKEDPETSSTENAPQCGDSSPCGHINVIA